MFGNIMPNFHDGVASPLIMKDTIAVVPSRKASVCLRRQLFHANAIPQRERGIEEGD